MLEYPEIARKVPIGVWFMISTFLKFCRNTPTVSLENFWLINFSRNFPAATFLTMSISLEVILDKMFPRSDDHEVIGISFQRNSNENFSRKQSLVFRRKYICQNPSNFFLQDLVLTDVFVGNPSEYLSRWIFD